MFGLEIMSLREMSSNRPIAAKIGVGLVGVALLGGVIGAVGFIGLSVLGAAVNQTSQSAGMLVGVNDASNAVSRYLEANEASELDDARAALTGVTEKLDALGSVANVDLEAARLAVSNFEAQLVKLGRASKDIKRTSALLDEALNKLTAFGYWIEDENRIKAETLATEAASLADTQEKTAEARMYSQYVQISVLRALASFHDFAASGDKATLKDVPPLLKSAGNIARQIQELSKSPVAMEKISALRLKLETLSKLLAQLSDPATIVTDEAIRAKPVEIVEAILVDARAIAKIARTELENSTKDMEKKFKLQAVKETATNLGREFGRNVSVLSSGALGALSNFTPAKLEELQAHALQTDATGIAIKDAGMPNAAPLIEQFNVSIVGIAKASTALNTARTAVLEASTAASDAIEQVVAERASDAASSRQISTTAMLASIAVSAILAALVSIGLTRVIAGPITALTAAMRRLASGDTDVTFGSSERQDEIGGMLRAVRVFRDNAIERRQLEAKSADEQANRSARQDRIERSIAAFRVEIEELVAAVAGNADQMEATAKALSSIADSAQGRAQTASSASLVASGSVQTVAAAADELSTSISEISRQAATATEVVGRATINARQADTTITGLASAADRIGDVIALIKAIAEQTNLLALNATIEAARAGESGRGFAVVASEVKTLASQTAKATEDIASQIASIQSATGQAVMVIRSISEIMSEVARSTGAIAGAVVEQGHATEEISSNAQSAASGTEAVVGETNALMRVVSETNQSAAQVLAVSNDVNDQAAQLRASVDRFLSDVLAA